MVACETLGGLSSFEDVLNYQKTSPRGFTQFSPRMLFAIGNENSTVRSFLDYWKNGLLSWEEMLIGLSVELARQNGHLLKEATVVFQNSQPLPATADTDPAP